MIIFVAPANGIESQKVLFRNEPKMDTKYGSNPGQHLWREKAFLSPGEQSYSSIASLGQLLFILICAFERLEWFVVATQDHGWLVSTLGLRVKLMQKGNEGSWRKFHSFCREGGDSRPQCMARETQFYPAAAPRIGAVMGQTFPGINENGSRKIRIHTWTLFSACLVIPSSESQISICLGLHLLRHANDAGYLK